MPLRRSAPVARSPARRSSPLVAVSSPPTIRISVVLPQPEGPRNTTNSPPLMSSDTLSMTWTGAIRESSGAKTLLTRSISMKALESVIAASQVPEPAPVRVADQLVGHQSDDANRKDAGHHLRRLHEAAHRPDRMADTGVGGHDLGDDEIGPAPAERDSEIVDLSRQHRKPDDVLQDLAVPGAERIADLDEFPRHTLGIVGDQQHELEERAHPQHSDLRGFLDAEPDDQQRHQRR